MFIHICNIYEGVFFVEVLLLFQYQFAVVFKQFDFFDSTLTHLCNNKKIHIYTKHLYYNTCTFMSQDHRFGEHFDTALSSQVKLKIRTTNPNAVDLYQDLYKTKNKVY